MTYFAPASVTAFFSPFYSDNPLSTGSLGLGITLERGVRVKARTKEAKVRTVSKTAKIKVNGKDFKFKTIETLFERMFFNGELEIKAEIPIGCGFGFSGASCLASAFEINEKLGLKMPPLELADLSHECEVLSSTGLGDVVCQYYGGVVLRKKAASPSRAEIERFSFGRELSFLVLGPISTKKILKDEDVVEKIQKFGLEAVEKFPLDPSLDNLFKLSKEFALKTGLMDDELAEIIEEIERKGYRASMVMLGKAIFSDSPVDLLKDYGFAFSSKISKTGVHKLD
ncbi:MAG: GHMP kinase [Archaeoglobus sp.]|nr:GHMP kinase [Archaeoglobus sp.]